MIEFKPDIKEGTVIYTAHENGEQTGSVMLTLDSATHSTLRYAAALNDETAEGLIRSALTAAANRNIFACTYIADAFREIAVRLGFKEKNGLLYGEIPFLLSGCCGCSRKLMS